MCVFVGVVNVICSLTKGKASFPLALASPGHPPLHLLPHWKCRMWKERRRKSVQGEGGGESISIWRISPPVTKFSLADSPPGHAQRVRRCFSGSKHGMGGRRGGQGQFNARFAHNSSHLHLIAPYLLAAGHFCKMRFWKCVKSYLS